MLEPSEPLPHFPIDLTDADQTLRLPAADRTFRDLASVGEDAPAEVELSEEDVLEVTQRRAPSLPPPLPPPHRPTSLSPIAMDVAPRARRRMDSTVLVPRVRARAGWLQAAAAGSAACAIFGAALLGMTASKRATSVTSTTSAEARHAAMARVTAAIASKELVRTVEGRESTNSAPLPAPALPAAESTSAPAPAPVAARTGVLRVPPSIHGMLVDGRPRRVDGSTLVTCGRHAIKTGIAPARTIEVPCGGTVWL